MSIKDTMRKIFGDAYTGALGEDEIKTDAKGQPILPEEKEQPYVDPHSPVVNYDDWHGDPRLLSDPFAVRDPKNRKRTNPRTTHGHINSSVHGEGVDFGG